MASTTEHVLHRTMVATFEELGHMVPDLELSPAQQAAPADAVVSVAFRGPLSGRLILRVSSVILPDLTANMLGSQVASDTSLQRDALGELANVICGNLLPQVAGSGTVFMLSAPHWQAENEGISDAHGTVRARATLGVDNGKAIAELMLFGEESGTDNVVPAVA